MTVPPKDEALDGRQVLGRTKKARTELSGNQRTLGLLERRVLLMADGFRSIDTVRPMVGPQADAIIRSLVRSDFLELTSGASAEPLGLSKDPPTPSDSGAPATVAPPVAPPAAAPPSLAETRMFLFDLVELTMVRNAPDVAQRWRASFREARDAASMEQVLQGFLVDVERRFGSDRAQAVRERALKRMPYCNG